MNIQDGQSSRLRQSSKSRSTQTIEIKTVSRKFVANQCYFGLSREVIDVILCHWSCHCCAVLWWTLLSFYQSGVVVARETNCMKARQSEAVTVFLFFVPLPGINPTIPNQGHFVLSPVLIASRDWDGGLIELNDRHLWSHEKIGNVNSVIE